MVIGCSQPKQRTEPGHLCRQPILSKRLIDAKAQICAERVEAID